MKQTRPFAGQISEKDKVDLETLAMGDGIQRGIFFDTSGKLRKGMISATAENSFCFKTVHGQPFQWLAQVK